MAKKARVMAGTAVVVALAAAVTFWAANVAVATGGRYVTATADTGDVTQVFSTTGTVERTGTVDATFTARGTVASVKVGVGDKVKAGATLATLDEASLKLALLDAESTLAQAKASLYSAQHPASSTTGGASLSSGALPSGAGSSGTGASSTGAGVSQEQLKPLLAAVAEVARASAAWSSQGVKGAKPTTCDRVYAGLTGGQPSTEPSDTGTSASASPSPSATPTVSATPTPSPSATPTATAMPQRTPSATATASPTAAASDPAAAETDDTDKADTPTPSPTATPSSSESPSASASPTPTSTPSPTASALAVTADDVTVQDITSCGEARAELAMATVKLSSLYATVITAQASAAKASASGASAASAKAATAQAATTASRASTTASASASAVDQAKASVLQAQQSVDQATDDLDAATLTSPVDGTVGAVTLAAGGSSAAGSVTVVGSGKASVTIELPLATRQLVAVGQTATLVPAGSLSSVEGTITQISTLETSGTAGTSPTYTTTLEASDPEGLLADGSRATVRLDVATARGVVRVPVSAVTPTGSHTGTVTVLDGTAATEGTTVTVALGAVGGGYAEVKEGLTSGQLVALADTTAPLPSADTTSRRTVTTTVGG